MSSTAVAGTQGRSRQANNAPMFEFQKRKRWAQLLVDELAGTIMLVLSPDAEVLYCGAAAAELLGWREEDVIDTELADWLHEDDVSKFLENFDSCVTSQTELSTFARLRGKLSTEPRWPMFELRGHPHFDPDQRDCKCFFVMARPYPSRSTAMLDSFLELKIENERLRARLSELRPSASAYPPPPYLSAPAISNMRGGLEIDGPLYHPSAHHPPRAPYYHVSASRPPAPPAFEDHHEPYTNYKRDIPVVYNNPVSRVRSRDEGGDDKEEAARKKKLRKLASGQSAQYVCHTCGRTDSPEWRKGPLGAKTLCNACGLRWAKRNSKRKADGQEGSGDDGKDSATGHP